MTGESGGGDRRPTVSLVTPSLDQGRFLRAAIESVLAQDYPAIEYRVVDGGSTDGTLELLRSYGDRVSWVSERDHGQADAIAKGLERTGGGILGWLNADDVLEPGAVSAVVEAFRTAPEAVLVYGEGGLIDEGGEWIDRFREVEPFGLWRLVHGLDYVLQPAAFFRADAYRACGGVDRRLHWALDWDLWIRLAATGEVVHLQRQLARSRVWSATKTATGGWRRLRELRHVVRRHAGRSLTPGLRLYALDTVRGRLSAGPAWLRRLADACLQRLAQRIVTRMAAFPDGWLGPDGRVLVPRRWGAVRLELDAPVPASGKPVRVRIRSDGERAATVELPPGGGTVELRLPIATDGRRPFAELAIESDAWFRTAADPRRLAIRCLRVAPARAPVAAVGGR